MADNNLNENLVEKVESEHHQHSEKAKTDTIVPLLLLLITASGMSVSGLGYALTIYNSKSFIYGFILLILLSASYWVNQRIVNRACHENKEHSYSKLILKLWGRKRGITVQILMAIHNIIIIAYLQQRIAVNAYRIFSSDAFDNPDAPSVFYYIAIANIPLILLALFNDFGKIKWFAIVGILVWVYLFIGVITEGFSSPTLFSDNGKAFPEPDLWMLTSIGLLAYFMSAFQVIPYIHGVMKDNEATVTVINQGAIGSAVIIASVFFYFAFTMNENLHFLRNIGFVFIGSCVAIINVLPTREFIVQILQQDAKDKQKTRDRFITVVILTITLFLGVLLNETRTWMVFMGIGAILTSLLGFVFPAVLYARIQPTRDPKQILAITWNALLGATVFVAGIFMMIVEEGDLNLVSQ